MPAEREAVENAEREWAKREAEREQAEREQAERERAGARAEKLSTSPGVVESIPYASEDTEHVPSFEEAFPMSPTELDLSLLPSSDEIRRREFGTIRRGYDPHQVRDYLQQVATQVENLEHELREARLHAAPQEQVVTIPEPGPADDPYERLAARVADVLRASDEQAEGVLRDAREEAALILVEARTETGRIREDAQSRSEDARRQANEILQNAKVEAERVLSSLSARRETLVEQLQQMQSRLMGFAQELEAAIVEPSNDDEPRAVSPEAGARGFNLPNAMFEEPVATQPVVTEPAVEGPTTEAGEGEEDDPIDPRYEDLWVSRETIARDPGDLTPGQEDPSED